MPDDKSFCLRCKRSSDEVPLIPLNYKDEEYWICAQDLPLLIHKPIKLSEELPGAENFPLWERHEHH